MTGPNDPPETWADFEARRSIAEALDRSLLVEAAAGTGKTESLVQRLVAVVRSGRARLDQIAALTFAEKAAGELKLRLRQRLEEARREATDPTERARLEQAMGQIETAHVSTFHGFCADILRELPLEAGLDPAFVVSADDGMALYEQAFDRYWQAVLADPPVGVRRMLRQRTWSRDEGPRGALHAAGRKLVQHRDHPAPWAAGDEALDLAEMERLVDRLAELSPYASEGKSWDGLRKGFAAVHEFVRSVRYRRQAAEGDEEALRDHAEWLDAGLRRMLGRDAGLRAYVDRYPRHGRLDKATVVAHRDEVRQEIEAWAERTGPQLAAQLQQALRPLVEEYERVMRESAAVDYLELLLRARSLLRDHPQARRALRSRFSHLFVDEVQDADVVQMEIAWSLACEPGESAHWLEATPAPGALFLVGDPKQSIYRWRRADLRLYQRLASRVKETGGAVVTLRRSFRAVPGIHAFVNKAFGKAMVAEDGVQPAHVDLESHRTRSGSQPAVIGLPMPRPYGKHAVTKGALKKESPRAIAAFVHWLVRESGWTVEDGSERRPIEMRDVCILFRQQRDWGKDRIQEQARALEAQAIAHVAGGQKGGAEREELGALRQALGAIEWPDDALRVYATLRGPFFGLPDESLFLFHQKHGRIHPLDEHDRAQATEPEAQVLDALAILRELHVRRNERPLADTVIDLMERVRMYAGVVLWRAGTNAMAHLRALADRVRAMEAANPTSFRALVERLEEDVELGRDVDTLPFEEEVDGVRLMTVHKAKGLEFQVVILADPHANGAGGTPSQWVDLEKKLWAERICGASPAELIENAAAAQHASDAEELRILYVACTRARELLVVPAVGDGPPEPGDGDHGWLAPLYAQGVLFIPRKRRHEVKDAPGCPSMSEERTVLARAKSMTSNDPMRPGLQPHGLVWWSAERLQAGRHSPTGVRPKLRELLAPSGKTGKAAIADHERWVAEREALRSKASVPTIQGRTITALGAERGAELGAAIATTSTDAAHDVRPRGARFGTLVHLVLAEVPFDAGEEAIGTLARAHGRLIGATDDERTAATRAVVAALRHPLLVRAAAATRVRREVPLVYPMADGTLAEGVADLAFEEGAGDDARWTVVDFKTDLADGADEAYRGQIALYVEAIEAATDRPAEGVLLGV